MLTMVMSFHILFAFLLSLFILVEVCIQSCVAITHA